MTEFMERLPDEILLRIFGFLDYKSLIKLQTVSSRFFCLTNSNDLWKPFCTRVWLITELLTQDISWKSCFQRFHASFGRYIDCYAELKRIWQEIHRVTAERVSPINESLNFENPMKEDELNKIEECMGHSLPDDFRCSYRICDGQSSYIGGLFGGYDEDDPGDLLISLRNDAPTILDEARFFRSKDFSSHSALLPFIGRKNNLGSFIIRPHFFLALFLTKQASDATIPCHGSIVSLQHDHDSCEFFVYAKSFKSLLQNHLEQLKTYPIHNGHILKFSFNSRLDTGPFHVETRTAFLREHSSATVVGPRFLFRYYITIKMDEQADQRDSCQLETRHWIITDGNGVVEHVDGPGVVGQYPTMTPGASHYWISGTSYTTMVGEMKGHFMMRNLRKGTPVEIVCPPYVMHAPEIIRCRLN